MRYVKLNQSELHKIKELYEGVMSHACHGLFFKEGSVIGSDMAAEALRTLRRIRLDHVQLRRSLHVVEGDLGC